MHKILLNIHQIDKHYLDDARMEALSPPKQEKATAMGIVQLKIPNTWSAKVWWKGKEKGNMKISAIKYMWNSDIKAFTTVCIEK